MADLEPLYSNPNISTQVTLDSPVFFLLAIFLNNL